jgi:hypothetical protein
MTNYRTRWFTSKELNSIARRFDVTIDLRDVNSRGTRSAGAYGSNVEEKLSRFVEDMRTVRLLLAQGDWSR